MDKPELVEDQGFEDMARLRTHHDEVARIIWAWTTDQDPIVLFHHLVSDVSDKSADKGQRMVEGVL